VEEPVKAKEEAVFKEDQVLPNEEEEKQTKIGRPFKGTTVLNDGSKENNVKEKRSIFRDLKKFYLRGSHKDTPYAGKKWSVEKQLLDTGLKAEEIQWFVNECITCMSFDHF
jgi:hypothetical protein